MPGFMVLLEKESFFSSKISYFRRRKDILGYKHLTRGSDTKITVTRRNGDFVRFITFLSSFRRGRGWRREEYKVN